MRIMNDMDFKSLTPLWDEVVIEVTPTEEKTKGGILLPDSAKDTGQHAMIVGTVVAMGPMAFNFTVTGAVERMDVNIGDRVVFRPYAGDMHESSKARYRLMNSRSVVGVMKG